MMQRTWEHVRRLGTLGVGVYLGTTCVSMLVFLPLLHFGLADRLGPLQEWLPQGATTVVGAYALTKMIQVPRMLFTIAFTPLLARWLGRAVEAGEPGRA